MSTILETIAEYAKIRVENDKLKYPFPQLKVRAFEAAGISGEDPEDSADLKVPYPFPEENPFYRNLRKPGIRFICEVKKASPSKGIIAENFPYVEIAEEYEKAGADCISCLTEPKWFLGSDEIFTEIRKKVKTPMIRKDFVVDEYQIYQAKVMGSDAILLICAILPQDTVKKYLQICHRLGMVAVVETHDEEEIRQAVETGARIIGVNNRNLKDFSVDITNSKKLRALVPEHVLFVAESGIQTPKDIADLRCAGADAVLIGETLMRAKDKKEMLKTLRGEKRTKICGMMSKQDIAYVNELQPDYCGFVINFPKSHRNLSVDEVKELCANLQKEIKPVGVFVDEPVEEVAKLLNEGIIAIAQLHGSEDNAYIEKLKSLTEKPVWKAFQIKDEKDVFAVKISNADFVIVDSGQGSGQTFDWKYLEKIDRPFGLAGGLNPDNVGEALRTNATLLDVSGGVETDRKKDKEKIRAFLLAVKE